MSDTTSERVEHLKLLQAAISRMAGESANIKRYALASTAAILSVATAAEAPVLAFLGALLLLLFWAMDAQYLAQERWFREMYEEARAGKLELFVLTPPESVRGRHRLTSTMRGWSTSLHPALAVLLVLVTPMMA